MAMAASLIDMVTGLTFSLYSTLEAKQGLQQMFLVTREQRTSVAGSMDHMAQFQHICLGLVHVTLTYKSWSVKSLASLNFYC